MHVLASRFRSYVPIYQSFDVDRAAGFLNCLFVAQKVRTMNTSLCFATDGIRHVALD